MSVPEASRLEAHARLSRAMDRAVPDGRPMVLIAVLAATLVAAAIVILRLGPTGGILLPPCPFKVLTGLACPGCGSVRAMHQLLHGNLVAALDLNPLAVLLLPLVAWQLATMVVSALWGVGLSSRGFRGRGLRGRALWSPLETRWSAGIVLGAAVSFWILRNVNCFPFTLLAP